MQRLLPAKSISTMERTVRMKDALGAFKDIKVENDWDHHGSYQWTYFVEEQKKLINFFLSKKAGPRNLEIGGGWYQSYPNSTAIDISNVCLKYNEARKKVQYDLDYLGVGFKLPFKDHSFDSATMISVWQYLENPVAVLKELERVLAPGGEVYVINGQGAGVEGLVKNASRSEDIRKIARKCGYDTLLQTIPSMSGERDTFKSVCIAMPGDTLFGPRSRVYQKRGKVWATGTSKQFLGSYAEWELEKIRKMLSQLKAYPITEYSLNYLETCERISQRFHEKTGKFPVLYAESHQLEVDMHIKEGFISSNQLMTDEIGTKESFSEFTRSLGINLGFGQNYTSIRGYVKSHIEGKDILPKILDHEHCGFELYSKSVREREGAIYAMADFIASVPLNSHTKSLQQSLLERLEKENAMDGDGGPANPEKPRRGGPDIMDRVAKARARRLYYLCCEYKQRRIIDKLIDLKKRLKDIEIANEASLDASRELSYFMEFILAVPMGYSEDMD